MLMIIMLMIIMLRYNDDNTIMINDTIFIIVSFPRPSLEVLRVIKVPPASVKS